MSFNNNSFDKIPIEIIIEIFRFQSLKQLIILESVCLIFKEIIRSTKWNHFIVKLKDIKLICYIINNYKFSKYDFSYSQVTDENVKLLENCHTLNLS